MFIKFILTIIILLIISRIVDRFIRKEFSLHEAVIWSMLWVAAAFLVIWPDASSWLAEIVGIGRGVDLIIYLALILVFYLLFRIFLRFEKMERNITKIVSKIALDEAEEEGKKQENIKA